MWGSSHPFLSIVMPVYNCEQTLSPALRSILLQSFGDWELLLIEDGSSDRTLELAQSFPDPRVHVFADGEHLGLVCRLNQAIDWARGKYLARMDGDDVSYPDRLTAQVKWLEANPGVDLLGGGILIFGNHGEPMGTREVRASHAEICRRPWAGFYLPHPTWMGKTEWFRRYRYRPEAVRSEDQDLLLRSYRESRFAALEEIVLGYREAKPPLRKILTGRRSFARSVRQEALARGQYRTAVLAAAEQICKGAVDAIAISTGLDHRLLRHRALPLEGAEKQRWTTVWERVQPRRTSECAAHTPFLGEPV